MTIYLRKTTLYRVMSMLLATVLLVGMVAFVFSYMKSDAVDRGHQLKDEARSVIIDSFESDTTSPFGATRTVSLHGSEGSTDYSFAYKGVINSLTYGYMHGEKIFKLGAPGRSTAPSTWHHYVKLSYDKTIDLSSYDTFSFWVRLCGNAEYKHGTIGIAFGSDGVESNCHYFSIPVSGINIERWTEVVIKKSQFNQRSADWSKINTIFFRVGVEGAWPTISTFCSIVSVHTTTRTCPPLKISIP